ncbi:TlpA family protein disulfide reductase [Sphingobacterium sp. SGG-5]|uniref:TlpA family protein disulfide reductase n=1 Tax=Sphingobacterium sp. SGG-5 TaxID=2710881 RepID=UPI0013EDF9FF|nr:TlpA disulfide reductase family protein [Sphingobacterium sp. SGG-5]NGM62681.1 TlpA family protein disulfide reductase [Sphingobacterium sp. SGG-5]
MNSGNPMPRVSGLRYIALFFVSFLFVLSDVRGQLVEIRTGEGQSKSDTPASGAVDLVATGLQVGDRVPDLLVRNVHNHKTDATRLSAFAGKLLILDFWATWCAPCVAMIPRMDSLQRHFGDRVQFLSVTYQPGKEVLPFLERFEKQRNRHYEVPYITGDKQLHKLFPHRTLPHYVWIDGEGTVKAITGSQDVHAANIGKALDDGLAVTQKRDMKMAYDRNRPLLINGNGGDGRNLIYHSLFAGYTEGLPTAYTLSYMSRHGFNGINATNMTLLQLYRLAYRIDGKYFGWNRTVISTRDSLFLRPPKGTKGADFRAWMNRGNGFCYAASSTRDSLDILFERMRADLGRLFPQYSVAIREKEVACLVLRRTSDKDKIATKGGPVLHEFGNGCRLRNSSLDVLTSRLEIIYLQNQPYPVINDTGYTGAVDMVLEADLTDLGQLNADLAGYDLTLEVQLRKTHVLEIDDVT